MKRNTKTTFKSIITMIVCAALLVTGIGFNDTMTASAATTTYEMAGYTVEQFTTKISMKPGEEKRYCLMATNGLNLTATFDWTSSDESVVSIENWAKGQTKNHYMKLTAENTGTATVTVKSKNTTTEFVATVTVGQAKQTEKQKACKHSWKTTRKATCQRVGSKTCKKCKLVQTIKKTGHKYSKKWLIEEVGVGHYLVLYCSHDYGKPDFDTNPEKYCHYEIDSRDYPGYTRTQLMEIMLEHRLGVHGGGSWGDEDHYESYKTVKRKAITCDYCGIEKK